MTPVRTVRRLRLRALLPWLALMLAVAGISVAEVPPAQAPAIASARAALDRAGLDEASAALVREQLDAAAAADSEAESKVARIVMLRDQAAAAPARSADLQQSATVDRAAALAQWRQRLPDNGDVDTLERLLDSERTAVASLRSEIDRVGSQLAQALARPVHLADERDRLQQRIDDLSRPLADIGDAAPVSAEARRLRRGAELRQAHAELEMRQAEQDTAAARQRLLELELRELRHRLSLHEPRLEILQERIVELGREELDRLAANLADQAAAAAGQSDTVAEAAERNRLLGVELVETNERLARDRQALAEAERERARLATALRDSRTRLAIGTGSDEVGRWLWRERRQLESPARIAARLAQWQTRLGELRLRLVTLAEQQDELADLPAFIDELQTVEPASDDDDALVVDGAGLSPLLHQRFELLARLEPLLRRRVSALEQGERALQDQLGSAVELQQTLDRHLLWIRSHLPISPAWLQRLPEGLGDLVKPTRFATTGRLLLRSASDRPWPYLGAAALVLALLWLRRQVPSRLEALAQGVGRVRQDRYQRTALALGWTLLAAAPWPLAMWLGGWLLQGIGEVGRYSDSLGRALGALALPMLTLTFLHWLVVERGLAHAHFRWTRPRREAIRRWWPILMAALLPAYFVMVLGFLRNQELAIDVASRIAIVLICATGAAAMWWLLAPGRLWKPRGFDPEPSSLRRALRVLLPALLAASALLALAGFVYSAAIVVNAQFASVGIVIAVAVLHGLLARWFLLGERRLALHRLEQRRAAEADGTDVDTGEAMPDLAEEVSLEMVNAQSRRLLRALRLTLLVLGLAWVWSGVMPAFARLDEVALWHFQDLAADGSQVQAPVTLMAAVLGVLVLGLTVVAARNLPGLIELGLMSRTGIDAASRYAITSVTRYAIVITGLLFGVGLLGLRWSQLQWMAAALSVGLGFGLQEIFANFVSGLILLFERPFRVGDVITIGELSGTVTRIRTRATTILDFDNKEIVVPNKTFITGQLINWTLTDTTTRITIKVGVAYGSDVDKVHALLMQAARDNARVLADPAPRSWFLAFGASSLDFELRVFVPGLADRLAVQNELNGAVAAMMAEQGIEIAFPQLDLHVRDVPEPASTAPAPASPTPPAPTSKPAREP